MVLVGCATRQRFTAEWTEKVMYKISAPVNRLDKDYWPKIQNCVVYIPKPKGVGPGFKTYGTTDYYKAMGLGASLSFGVLGGITYELSMPKTDKQFEQQINDYLGREGWGIADIFADILQEKSFLPPNISMNVVFSEDLLELQLKEADVYMIIVIGGSMYALGGYGRAYFPLTLSAHITIIPKEYMAHDELL